MDLTKIVLDILEIFKKTYYLISLKPYATVKVQFIPQRDTPGKITEELIALVIINECFGEIDVQRIWFLTSFKRQIISESINSEIPVKVLEKQSLKLWYSIKMSIST